MSLSVNDRSVPTADVSGTPQAFVNNVKTFSEAIIDHFVLPLGGKNAVAWNPLEATGSEAHKKYALSIFPPVKGGHGAVVKWGICTGDSFKANAQNVSAYMKQCGSGDTGVIGTLTLSMEMGDGTAEEQIIRIDQLSADTGLEPTSCLSGGKSTHTFIHLDKLALGVNDLGVENTVGKRLTQAEKMLCVLLGGDPKVVQWRSRATRLPGFCDGHRHQKLLHLSHARYSLNDVLNRLTVGFKKRGLDPEKLDTYFKRLSDVAAVTRAIKNIESGKVHATNSELAQLKAHQAASVFPAQNETPKSVIALHKTISKRLSHSDYADKLTTMFSPEDLASEDVKNAIAEAVDQHQTVTSTGKYDAKSGITNYFFPNDFFFRLTSPVGVLAEGNWITFAEMRKLNIEHAEAECPICARGDCFKFHKVKGQMIGRCFSAACDSRVLDNGKTKKATQYPEINEYGFPIAPNTDNTLAMFKNHGIEVRKNLMTWQMEVAFNGAPETGEDTIAKLRSTATDERYMISRDDIAAHLSVIALENEYHPVVDWLSEEKWDGEDRFEELWAQIEVSGEDKPLYKTMFRTWVRSVMRVLFYPGTALQGAIVFQGSQGCGKTSFVTALFPTDLKAVKVGRSIIPGKKESVTQACTALVVELGEIESTMRSEMAALKAFITSPEDEIRPLFINWSVTRPRRAAFIGTVNSTEFLRDDTGNRRFWVIPTKKLNGFHNVNMRQFWLQMAHEVDSGAPWFLSKEDSALLDVENQRYAQITEDDVYALAVEQLTVSGGWTPNRDLKAAADTYAGISSFNDTRWAKALTRAYGKSQPRVGKGRCYPCTLRPEYAGFIGGFPAT